MNYYIRGNKEKAGQIKAAFEKLGYDISWQGGFANPDVINIGVERCGAKYVVAETSEYIKDIIKTHPNYQELKLPIESNFKVGDWIASIDDEGDVSTEKVEYFTHNKVLLLDTDGCHTEYPKTELSNFHLWTIADAKDGDVITNGKLIVIFNKLEEPAYRQHIIAYVGLDLCGRLQITEDTWQLGVDKAMPATKEQRDLLFAKMREAGYEWDETKKKLRKIQPHYDISNFKPFDKVLGRNCCRSGVWRADYFSHIHKNGKLFVGIGYTWEQCIPYNDDTKHLLGTTKPCGEEFINW